jgi:hypothetical protein
MCGKCPACLANQKMALAARDLAVALQRNFSVFIHGYETMIVPTLPHDVHGRDGCYAIVTSSMTDEQVIAHVTDPAVQRTNAVDGLIELLAHLRAAASGGSNPKN